jgi:hypothetical protein
MANLKLKNPSGGSLNFASADGASDLTVTFPAVTGTAMVSGNMPAFRATLSTQSILADTNTKMAFNTEDFDTASRYNHTGSTVGGIPAYSFLPNVAGYYQVSLNCLWLSYSAGVNQALALNINDNGATELFRNNFPSGNAGGSRLIYLNGTTDYINAYWYSTNGTSTLVGNNGAFFSNFSAVLVRAA